jgi:biotin carboxyl carrier protein
MLQITINDKNTFSVDSKDNQFIIDDVVSHIDVQWQPNSLISIIYNNKSYTAIVENVDVKNKEVTLHINGQLYKAGIKEPIDQLLHNMGIDLKAAHKIEPVKAPMPGMVLRVMVEAGQKISKGDGLLVLEAMKMENVLKASSDATVKAIKITERTAVEKGAILIELE